MIQVKIQGIVQGVGFRPFVFNSARRLGLKGYVCNSNEGVEIEVEGSDSSLRYFLDTFNNPKLSTDYIGSPLPEAARIESITVKKLPDIGYQQFEIRHSKSAKGVTYISPDLKVCRDCLRELNSKNDPRYDYPFINCTNCGPRYSIIEKTPYDRPVTSMKDFQMCSYCRNEYENPANRRFHAQPIACPECGPRLSFFNYNFRRIEGNPIENCLQALQKGKIVAIKGIGGFHLACDAANQQAVKELRKRKHRPHKPFAVMCISDNIHNIVECSAADMEVLNSAAAPVLLLPKKYERLHIHTPIRDNSQSQLYICEDVAPDNPYLGVLLPYAPHHHRLLRNQNLYLVMTSGNINDEPIALKEKQLEGIADCFLTHNRPIYNRNDDSVILPTKISNIIIRRSRGYVPTPISLPINTVPTFGAGAELKVSFSLTNGTSLYLSPYIGNNNSKATEEFYDETIRKFQKWFQIKPVLAACDLHPDYLSTRYAEKLNIPLIKVQHHHSHVAAVMADNMLNETVIGISYDGTGYGTDGAIWGGELFIADYNSFTRKYHLNYMPLPGGDAAIHFPVRTAYSYFTYSGEEPELFPPYLPDNEKRIICNQLKSGYNIFSTSSMGRLFDCVAALLGLCPEISFEAQSALALEYLCVQKSALLLHNEISPYPYCITKEEINIIPLLKALIKDISHGVTNSIIASRFHKTVIDFTLNAALNISRETGVKKVVLSGGVMQNVVLFEGLIEELSKNGLNVFYHKRLPSNDAAISVGQAVIANSQTTNKLYGQDTVLSLLRF